MSPDFSKQTLDVRPDRLDLRDREYRPPLKELPPQYPPVDTIDQFFIGYAECHMVLDQQSEGACTGFGLASVINYLKWRDLNRNRNPQSGFACVSRVSERMLYHMARIYDEWDGEDYSGSSCRGAMKGWHRHGVCDGELWPYTVRGKARFRPPKEGWATNAALTPLGAYYRINKDSVVDMQAAINEVGAIYCSANVHKGWSEPAWDWVASVATSIHLPVIREDHVISGGHAFALMGYTASGFVIQNSWGKKWGHNGFAVLTYSDWVKNGLDSWVAVRGAPTSFTSDESVRSSETVTNHALQEAPGSASGKAGSSVVKLQSYSYRDQRAKPWSEEDAYRHTVVLGNNGRPMMKVITAENADKAIEKVIHDWPDEWLKQTGHRKLAIYAHGGLNDEIASIHRIQVLAPYFKENGIYPIFVTWRTGVEETLKGVMADWLGGFTSDARARGLDWQDVGDWAREKFDRLIESSARNLGGKSIWSEMKQNARAASDSSVPGAFASGATRKGGMVNVATALGKLKQSHPNLDIHLVGHSAGSILLGYWLPVLARRQIKASSLTLYAPACTVDFANKYFKDAVSKRVLRKNRLFFELMSDERELADTVGPYKKSLLYLVSRAFEDMHKTPILGMQAAWNPAHNLWKDGNSGDTRPAQTRRKQVAEWLRFAKTLTPVTTGPDNWLHDRQRSQVPTNLEGGRIALAHGSFDNDIEVVTRTLKRIREGDLEIDVENLGGF